ncbi:MAG: diaminopimelate epimerase [Cyclobacteriaceae bacterium]|nr:diaminopimelate epimerase [Cyclobacteriaceae bacterium]
MMISFTKYQATGNDFILIDNRRSTIRLSVQQINRLCHRRFGIGADGLILIEPHHQADFYLNYYNSDGSQSLCGNGSRAAVHFAHRLGAVKKETTFAAYDGLHLGSILPDEQIRIQLKPVQDAEKFEDGIFIHTGSPHFIRWVEQVESYPVVEEGRKIRYSERFRVRGGTNVNFAERLPDNTIRVRTYERGVEDETLSCGTGVTACALAAAIQFGFSSPVQVRTRGGNLQVDFVQDTDTGGFSEIYLTGPVVPVFTGQVHLTEL